IEVVNPYVRRRLHVILVERLSGSVAPWLHAQHDRSAAIAKDRARLPGGLAWHLKVQITQARAVRVYHSGACLRREEQARGDCRRGTGCRGTLQTGGRDGRQCQKISPAKLRIKDRHGLPVYFPEDLATKTV